VVKLHQIKRPFNAMPDTPQALIVLITFPDESTAREITGQLVTHKLIACANLMPRIRSIYLWEGELQDDSETLAICKTTPERFEEVKEAVAQAHPYDVPEVIASPVVAGLEPYVDWVREVTG
jgi:periplasmic divalent cation tolerance protein